MPNKGHALSRNTLIRTLTAYSGITTENGAGDGTTLVDSNLKDNALIAPTSIPEKTILIITGDARGEDKGATDFDNSDGKITLQGEGFSHQIKAGTIFRILNISTVEIDVSRIESKIDTKIGTAADNADLGTLFAKHKRAYLGTHTHALVVVHDVASLDADLDTALKDWLEDIGFIATVCEPADVAANLELDAFDVIAVSASCVAGDAGNLANLKEAEVPVVCFSAAIAVSAVFNLGTTAATKAAQTQIEITDNSPIWLIAQALGNLTVTASATIYTIATAATNVVEFGQEANGTNLLTLLKLPQGEQDGGTPTYAPFFDRYFVGVGDFTLMNAVFKAILENLFHHAVHEKRFDEGLFQVKRVYQEQIPDTDFSLAAIDNALTADPPSADAANSIVDLDQRVNLAYVLRSLWVNVTSFGTAGTQLTFQLWVLLNGSVTSVDSVVVSSLGIQNLMDIFGLQEVHADGIWITVITDSGSADAACEGTYRYAEARK